MKGSDREDRREEETGKGRDMCHRERGMKEKGVGGRGMKWKKREGRSSESKGIKKCSLQLSLC